jgi:DNA-binding CsgD family transcriptional regulator
VPNEPTRRLGECGTVVDDRLAAWGRQSARPSLRGVTLARPWSSGPNAAHLPDQREAPAEFLLGLGYEPSTQEVPRFGLEDASDPRLTPREAEVLRLMAKGYTHWDITEMLYLGSGMVGRTRRTS